MFIFDLFVIGFVLHNLSELVAPFGQEGGEKVNVEHRTFNIELPMWNGFAMGLPILIIHRPVAND
jgi:hypothetical protein